MRGRRGGRNRRRVAPGTPGPRCRADAYPVPRLPPRRCAADRRAAAFVEHGLQGHEFDVLAALRRSGEPFELTAGELCTATHVTSGTMTSRLDRLVARSLVVRRPDEVDGRLVRVRLTAEGRRRVDAALQALLVSESELLEQLPASARERLTAALRDLLAATSR